MQEYKRKGSEEIVKAKPMKSYDYLALIKSDIFRGKNNNPGFYVKTEDKFKWVPERLFNTKYEKVQAWN